MRKLLLAAIIVLLLLWCSYSHAQTEITVEIRSITSITTYKPFSTDSCQYSYPVYDPHDVHDAIHTKVHEHRLPQPPVYMPSYTEVESVQYIRVRYREDEDGD